MRVIQHIFYFKIIIKSLIVMIRSDYLREWSDLKTTYMKQVYWCDRVTCVFTAKFFKMCTLIITFICVCNCSKGFQVSSVIVYLEEESSSECFPQNLYAREQSSFSWFCCNESPNERSASQIILPLDKGKALQIVLKFKVGGTYQSCQELKSYKCEWRRRENTDLCSCLPDVGSSIFRFLHI